MGLLDDIQADDMNLAFIAEDGFAETCTYVNRAGDEREILAIIDRNPPATRTEVEQGVAPAYQFAVKNSGTLGISVDELQYGGSDKLRIAKRFGGTDTTDVSLSQPIYQDAGGMVFRIARK